jgi:hypothetical protein
MTKTRLASASYRKHAVAHVNLEKWQFPALLQEQQYRLVAQYIVVKEVSSSSDMPTLFSSRLA